MSNKYLEKLAKNKFEQYLSDQPEDRVFSDPRVNSAHKNIHASNRAMRNAIGIHAVGGTKESVIKHIQMSKDIMRNHRGKIGMIEKGNPDPTFFNRHRQAIDVGLGQRLETYKKSKGILGLIRRNPKTSLALLGMTGVAGYGVKRLVKEAYHLPTDEERATLQSKVNDMFKNVDFEKTGDPKSNVYSKIRTYVSKHPGKSALIGAGGLAAAGGIGYGIKKINEK